MNKKRLAKKITTIGATTAIAFSVLAQPLSLIASATDAAPVTTAGEQQLAGAIVKSKNLVSNGKLTTIEQTNLTAKQIFPSWQAAAVGGGNNLDSLVLVGKDVNSRYVGTSTRDEYVYYKIDDSASDITSIGISGFGSTSYTTDYSGTGITEFTGRSTRSTRFALYQVIPTVVGQTYTLSKSVASNELNYSVYASNVGSISELASVKSTKYGSSTFVASSTSTKITVVLGKDADYVNEPALIWSRAASGVTVTKQINTTNLKAEIDALFINNNPDSGDIKDTTDEAAIDVLQKEIDCLEEGITKVEYQAELDLAKRYLNSEPKRQAAAEKAVKELFINNNVVNHIKETTNQAAIDAVQVKVNAVTDTTKKAALQVQLNKAQTELDAKTKDETEKAIEGAKDSLISLKGTNTRFRMDIKTSERLKYEYVVTKDDAYFGRYKNNYSNELNIAADGPTTYVTKDGAYSDGTVFKVFVRIDNVDHLIGSVTVTGTYDDAQKAVNELFISDNPANHIKDTTNQAAIDAAKVKVNAVTDTTKKAALQVQVKKAQDELDEKTRQEAAQKAVNELFISNSPANHIKDTTTQTLIDAAKVKVNAVTDTTKKAALQVQVKKAQDELDEKNRQEAAQKAVNELFISNSPANHIKDTTTQTLIEAAKVKVNAVTDTTKKAALQVQVKKAQDELDEKNRQEAAQKAVNELFVNNNPANKIKDTTTQTMIDEAQKKVDSVVNPAKRAELQELVDKAQDALDEANNNVTAPTANTVTNKDTVVTGTGKPGLTAVVNIGTATYTATVGTNGKFSVTITVQKADTIIRVSQKSTTKTSPVINVKVTNYIPNSAPIIDAIGPFQQAITGKVPAGTVSVRLVVNDHPQRLVTPDANGNFSFYSRFVTDGTVSNLRLQKGDKIVVDYGNKTPSNLATTTYVNDAVKPLIDVAKAESDYITGLVPTGTQVLRLSINGIAQRTVTPQADINAVTAGGIGTDGKFKIYTRFFRDSSGLTRKLHAGDTVTVDLGAQIPGDTGTTVTVIAK
ncbi:toxin Cry1Ac domain D-VI-related protein [Listeria ivanovii]|uniref:toxin Cry1Ac domain D-VI-related protein n=2 Tax=Listeria ivanovii TaxID=1638 RepID=UPI0003EC6AC5|nr:toxin Cry1Ac domain D-VI-related protein [Listeria ivanovii]AHI57334.1 hypothetical protein AX25_14140 [Listeria ivanovii WSLC3009]QDA70862.1 hypothetical protein EOS99_01030 [Listeria ivanovii]SNV49711.1 Uncharacterised protein [Listeria ivanovii subsp. ivanovii]SNV99583.1 Uncharacterised protein [Listeria ivanovii subsp. ivanovii]